MANGSAPDERLDPLEIELALSGRGDRPLVLDHVSHDALDADERVPLSQRARPWIRRHRVVSLILGVGLVLLAIAALVAVLRPRPAPLQPTTIAVEATGTPGNGATVEFRTISVELNLRDALPGGGGYTFVTVTGPRITGGRSTIDYVAGGQTVGGILYAEVDCGQVSDDDYRILLAPGRTRVTKGDSGNAVSIGLGPVEQTWRSLVRRTCDQVARTG